MSFVITHPEALTYAAGKLQTLGSALADSAQATAIHDLFVDTLGTSAAAYADTEAANSVATASPLSVFSGGLANIVNIGKTTEPGIGVAHRLVW